MGNQLNLSSENRKKIIQNINKLRKNSGSTTDKNPNSFLEINTKESSSYRGIKTIYNEDSSEKNTTEVVNKRERRTEKTTNCTSVTENVGVDVSNIKIPTNFEWKEPAGVVYLTGSFSNWTQWFMMSRKSHDRFELTLDLPRKKWDYKFIVDNKWSYSKHYPTCKDEKGNVNNYIDTTNYDVSKYLKQKLFDANSPTEENEIKPKERTSDSSGKRSQNSSFCNKFPNREDLNVESVRIPDNYRNTFKIKTFEDLNEKEISDLSYHHKNYFIKRRDIGYFGENISFASLPVPLHINL